MEANNDEFVKISCDIIFVTGSAALINDGETQDWIPLSQVNLVGGELLKGKNQEIEVKKWIAHKKGFI